MSQYYNLPRLYVESLSEGSVCLSKNQRHHLKTVLRLNTGACLRVFHPNCGEYLAVIESAEALRLQDLLRPPFVPARRVHVYAPPLPKDRFDFMIEKATELGMTDYHPLLTDRAQIRKINPDRLRAQMIEAAEQSERMDIPTLHDLIPSAQAVSGASGQLWACIERLEAQSKEGRGVDKTSDVSLFIGPAGGWTPEERDLLLAQTNTLDLGPNILRSETAVVAGLVTITNLA